MHDPSKAMRASSSSAIQNDLMVAWDDARRDAAGPQWDRLWSQVPTRVPGYLCVYTVCVTLSTSRRGCGHSQETVLRGCTLRCHGRRKAAARPTSTTTFGTRGCSATRGTPQRCSTRNRAAATQP